MSDSEPSIVFKFDNSDPEIQNAYAKARETFRYFYREIAWEGRRIIPGLEVAAVKAPFADPGPRAADDGNPDVEHMWLNEIEFDGRIVTGKILNTPNWLKSYQAGDQARIPLEQISDWMYVCLGEVYGAFTVNLLRSRMKGAELKEHDAAWGLDFGDPNEVKLVPAPKQEKPGLLQSWFGKKRAPSRSEPIGEHPMSVNCAPSYREQLTANPGMLNETHARGWTLLHQESLAGSAPTVQVLLELGADPNIPAEDGTTALQLARLLKWDKVIALLTAAGAR